MKNIKNLKKKIFGITLVVGLLVLSIVGTTMAYFTDTDAKTNVFTSGNVDIELNDDIFSVDLNTENIANVYPGQQISENGATVKNIGSEDAYVGVIITLAPGVDKDLVLQLFKDTATTPNSTLDLDADGDVYTVSYVETATGLEEIRIIYKNALKSKNSVAFFGEMNIPSKWDNNPETNENMKMFVGLKMIVKAYATQTQGFTNAADALTAAFDDWQ